MLPFGTYYVLGTPHEWLFAVPTGKSDYYCGLDGNMPRLLGKVSSWIEDTNVLRRKEEKMYQVSQICQDYFD